MSVVTEVKDGKLRDIKDKLRAVEDIEIKVSQYSRLQGKAYEADDDIERRLQRVKGFTRNIVGHARESMSSRPRQAQDRTGQGS